MRQRRARRESAEAFGQRHQWLLDWNASDGPRADDAGGIAFRLEALALTPDAFAQVLALADQVTDLTTPAALVFGGYRVGVTPSERTSGEVLGLYRGFYVIAWTVSCG